MYGDRDIARAVQSTLEKKGIEFRHGTEIQSVLPYSVFIDPPLSRVGLSEEQAIVQGYDIKAIVDSKTGLILECLYFVRIHMK
ncbi:hypothetical protein [Paenibacillus oryzisoli]|uniref:Uncharacterized protein n=1 Tax=Paenibacillus oryzisoli TaxID=1850517 RepID=A0A198A062_9BACL|nr:hypothetical protein A8708_04915 [Paenibacillus oryzisoli]